VRDDPIVILGSWAAFFARTEPAGVSFNEAVHVRTSAFARRLIEGEIVRKPPLPLRLERVSGAYRDRCLQGTSAFPTGIKMLPYADHREIEPQVPESDYFMRVLSGDFP
jgi:hypothetical protein